MAVLKAVLNVKPFSKWFSDETLTKKAYLNALVGGLETGAKIVVGFVINPLLVAGLGVYLYGVWRILVRLVGLVTPAGGRPTQALKWTTAYKQASTNYEEKRCDVGSAVVVWLLFLPLLAALGGLLVWFAPAWLNAPMEVSWSVRLATGLLVVNLIMRGLLNMPLVVLQGVNLGYKRVSLSTLLVFIGGGLTALALYFNTGLVGVAAATLATSLLTGALFLQLVRAYVPWFGISRPSREAVRRFFGLSWWFHVWQLVERLMVAGDIIVLGMLGSVELVTTYSLTRYTPEALVVFVAMMVSAITPGLGGIIGAGKLQKAARVRNEIMLLTWLVAMSLGTTILLWNQDFVRLWVGAEYYAGSIPTLLIMVMVTQFVLIRNDANIINLTLNLRHKVLIGALSAIVSLIVAGVLVGSFNLGITGICLGFIAGRSILSLGYPWLVGRFLGVSLFAQLKSVPRPAFITVLLFMLAPSAGDFLTANTWMSIIPSAGLTLMVVSSLVFYTGLSSDQRGRIWQRARRVI
jgi:O-antigen/teichoic acid export membrane protein